MTVKEAYEIIGKCVEENRGGNTKYNIIFNDGNIAFLVGMDLTFDEATEIVNRQISPELHRIIPM